MHPFESIRQCAQGAAKEPITIGTALSTLGEAGYPIICVLLSLPFMQPIPLGPVSVAGGITFMALGWQMFNARPTPWLPERMLKITLSEKTWIRIAWLCTWLIKIVSAISKPRMQSWVATPSAKKRLGVPIAVSGFLMTIPMFAVPFNNTLPALSVITAAIGDVEDDGLWIVVSLFFLIVTLAYFTFIGWTLLQAGSALI